jgi:lathosterol oxidase
MNDPTPVERPRAHLSLTPTEAQSWGHGWISGVFANALAILGLGAVLCFHYPEWLTMPQLRAYYPLTYVRALLHVVLVTAFLLGTISVWLRRNKALGLTAIMIVLLAALLGGSRVPIDRDVPAGGIFGLDWFLFNLILFSAVYIPLERLFARYPDQSVFRPGWRTDLSYFFLNNLFYLPDRWPRKYGLAGDGRVPSGWLRQFIYPFHRGTAPVDTHANVEP